MEGVVVVVGNIWFYRVYYGRGIPKYVGIFISHIYISHSTNTG